MTHFHALEPRQLLSAAPHALSAKPKIPNIVGTYRLTINQKHPTVQPKIIVDGMVFANETGKGAFTGTFPGDGDTPTKIKGAVNPANHFTLTFYNHHGKPETLATGTYNPKTHAGSGTFVTPATKGHPAQTGTFSITLIS